MNLTVKTTLKNVAKMSFSWYDYILFTLMLLASTLIGIYFGCFGSKQSTTNEYLMGNKRMRVFPITISLIASHISGITLLATPADVYRYGTAYMACAFSYIIIVLVNNYAFLPVFFKLNIKSTYEYLELRFDGKCRRLASFIFALQVFLYLPIVIYIPALAFSAATGFSVHQITPIVCGVCIFYTTIGGLKAVVYTDTLQFTITVGALCTIFTLGVKAVGGFKNIIDAAEKGDRLNIFDFDFDVTKRDSFWLCSIGLCLAWISQISVNQSCVQKFLSLETLREARIATVFYNFGCGLIVWASCIMGIIMYTKYSTCDPFLIGAVERNDQLLPYFIMDVGSQIKGLPGVFIAGLFCAALATLSACLNCLAGTIFEDFIKSHYQNISEKTASNILKLLVLIIGIICTCMVFFVEQGGGLLQLTISLGHSSGGPVLAIFILGMFVPRATPKGSFWGTVLGLIFTMWIVAMALYYKYVGIIKYPTKPLSIEGCSSNATFVQNITASTVTENQLQPFFLFRVSHYFYPVIGTLTPILFGLIFSFLEKKPEKVDKRLLSPLVHWSISNERNDERYYTEQAIKLMDQTTPETNEKC